VRRFLLADYGYQSMATPSSVIDFNMKTKEKVVLKSKRFGRKVDKSYIENVLGYGSDGTKVPISMVYRKDMEKNGENRCCYTYTALHDPPWMHISTTRLSLLDRGLFMLLLIFEGGEVRPINDSDGKCLKEDTFL
jgi:oligopeptidase B